MEFDPCDGVFGDQCRAATVTHWVDGNGWSYGVGAGGKQLCKYVLVGLYSTGLEWVLFFSVASLSIGSMCVLC